MSNIASILKAEIVRLARREIRVEITSLRKASTQHRSTIAALKREVQQLHKKLRLAGKTTDAAQTEEEGMV